MQSLKSFLPKALSFLKRLFRSGFWFWAQLFCSIMNLVSFVGRPNLLSLVLSVVCGYFAFKNWKEDSLRLAVKQEQ